MDSKKVIIPNFLDEYLKDFVCPYALDKHHLICLLMNDLNYRNHTIKSEQQVIGIRTINAWLKEDLNNYHIIISAILNGYELFEPFKDININDVIAYKFNSLSDMQIYKVIHLSRDRYDVVTQIDISDGDIVLTFNLDNYKEFKNNYSKLVKA